LFSTKQLGGGGHHVRVCGREHGSHRWHRCDVAQALAADVRLACDLWRDAFNTCDMSHDDAFRGGDARLADVVEDMLQVGAISSGGGGMRRVGGWCGWVGDAQGATNMQHALVCRLWWSYFSGCCCLKHGC
jgi:hypothetical protein